MVLIFIQIIKTLNPNKAGHQLVFEVHKSILGSSKVFNDISNHWAKDKINEFISKGYIKGYEDKTFRPDNSITRGEFVTIFNNVFGLTKSSGVVFKDSEKHWAKTAIDIAVTNKVAQGMSKTEFKPDAPITREQVAMMISNYKKLADTTHDKLQGFDDWSEVSDWAIDALEGIIESGYMSGYPDNTFKPVNNISRAEAVITLNRIK